MLAFWNLRPTPSRTHSYGGRRSIEWPFTAMSPAERSPPSAMQRISVVLPAPLGPTRLRSSPRRAVKSMPSRTSRLPKSLADPAHLEGRARSRRHRRRARRRPRRDAAPAPPRSRPSRRPPRRRRMTSGRDALGRDHDHEHEGDSDDELPHERHVPAQVGGAHVDQQRADHRPDQRAAPPERHPDHELGAEHEPGVLGRHHHLHAREGVARDRRDDGRDHQQQDLHPGHVESQVLAARLVLADGHQHAPGIAADEQPGSGGHHHEEHAGDPEPGVELDRRSSRSPTARCSIR